MSRYVSYLRANLTEYAHDGVTINEIVQALKLYTDLRPKMSSFTFNNGETRDVMTLQGTLPVQFRSNTYNIPVEIILLETYPDSPPMVYVRPTNTMLIKPNAYVDTSGKVYSPYLTKWEHHDVSSSINVEISRVGREIETLGLVTLLLKPSADLSGLFGVLIVIFQDQPPVFAKPIGSSGSSNQQPSGAQQQLLAYPVLSREESRNSSHAAIEEKLNRRLREAYAEYEAELKKLAETERQNT